jgi:phage I-like protein
MSKAHLKTQTLPGNVAVLTFQIGSEAGPRAQLLPAGEFKATDGRPMPWGAWRLTDENAPAVVALANSRANEFVIDYEHQTQLAEKNGLPAPAAGWFSKVEYLPGKGLFATDVRWTARAKAYIGGDEYKYISAVFLFDKNTGVVQKLLCAALTNDPGLDGMDAVQLAALTARFSTTNPEPTDMNPLLAKLLAALNLPATDATTEAQALGAVATLKAAVPAVPAAVTKVLGLADKATEAEVTTAVTALKASADKAAELTTEVATLKAANPGGNPDPTKFVALDKFTALNNEVAALKAAGVDRTVDELISEARLAGKCSPVVEEVWRGIGKVDVAQLKALIEKTPANPALAGLSQTNGKQIEKRDPKAAATADELAMCKNMGLTLEQFRAGADAEAAV